MADILYSLVGMARLVTKSEVLERVRKFGVMIEKLENVFHLLLLYGVLGIANATDNYLFIYDYDYDMKRLEAEIRNSGDEALYVVNAGLHVGLGT